MLFRPSSFYLLKQKFQYFHKNFIQLYLENSFYVSVSLILIYHLANN